MPSVALQQVSNTFARRNAARTLEKPIGLRFIQKYLAPELLTTLKERCPDEKIFVWGAKFERSHQFYKMPARNCLVFFRRGSKVFKYGVIIESTVNELLAESLWGRDSDGKAWSLIFFFNNIVNTNVPAGEMNRLLKRKETYNWQGLVAISVKESEKLTEFFKQEITIGPEAKWIRGM